jgi:hypothetical protein
LTDFPGLQRDDGIAGVLNNKAYVGTGSNGSNLESDFYCFDLSTQTWTTIASMPAGSNRQYASCFTYSNYLFVAGGLGTGNTVLNDTYRYYTTTNAWTTVAAKPGSPVWGACSFTLANKAYVVGGKYANSTGSEEVWEYDINADTWTQKNNLPFGARWRACSAVLNNVPYLLFGLDNTSTGAFRKEIYKYDQGNDSWIKVGDFPQSGRIYASMQAVNNKLVIFGGLDSLNNYYNDCWFFDEVNGFIQTTIMPSNVRKGGMSFAASNRFYYTCGINQGNTRLKELWTLDIPAGIKENKEELIFSVFPNPCADELFISSNDHSNYEISLLDVYGRTIQYLDPGQTVVDVHSLESGVYFLCYRNEKRTLKMKFIKQ